MLIGHGQCDKNLFQVVLQRNLPGTPDEEEEKGPLQLEAQHIQIIQIVVVFLLIIAV